MIDLFKQNDLNLEIKCNLKIVDDLDMFDLTTGLFKPYNKTNDMLMQNQINRHLY